MKGRRLAMIARIFIAALSTGPLAGCGSELAWSVANGIKAIQLCQDDGGLKRMLDNKAAKFSAECENGRIVSGSTE
ncbi:MAG: hypothetical protein K8F27_03655 [Sulfuricellaceae bacterium]|nr:hypothetical protein [Sulfuricellaceae bacterium]